MKIVLFDIDGTLLISAGAGREALETAFSDCFSLPLVYSVVLDGRPDRAVGGALLAAHGLADCDENWLRLRDAYLKRLPETLRKRPGRVLPGVRDLLEVLNRQPDVFVGLLTGNVRQGARLKLAHYSLLDAFGSELVGGFGDVDRDRNQVARRAMHEVHSRFQDLPSPTEWWVVGDTPWDIRSARAIGARAVAVATGAYGADELAPYGPDFVLESLERLESLPKWWRE